ncbi:hypothetical protein [Caminibacter sp.]
MSIMIMPVNFFDFVDFYKLILNNPELIKKIILQFKFLKQELQKNIDELNKQIENYNFKFIDENTDLKHLYEILDLQKENLKNILNFLKNNKNDELFNLIDDIYTLTLQLEDRISTLESYRDIEKLKTASCK